MPRTVCTIVRVVGVELDLGPQALHVHVHESRVSLVLIAPHLFEEHLAAEHLVGLDREREQELELERRERDTVLSATHLMGGSVDREVPDDDLRRCRGRHHWAQSRADASDELLGIEGLDDIVVRSRLKAEDDIRRITLGGEHDDRNARFAADAPADFDAVDPREHEIEENEIGLVFTETHQRGGAVGGEAGLEVFAAQHDSDHLGDRRVVIDHQDARIHRPRLLRSRVHGSPGPLPPA